MAPSYPWSTLLIMVISNLVSVSLHHQWLRSSLESSPMFQKFLLFHHESFQKLAHFSSFLVILCVSIVQARVTCLFPCLPCYLFSSFLVILCVSIVQEGTFRLVSFGIWIWISPIFGFPANSTMADKTTSSSSLANLSAPSHKQPGPAFVPSSSSSSSSPSTVFADEKGLEKMIEAALEARLKTKSSLLD